MKQEDVTKLLRYDPETGELFWFASHQRPDVVGFRAGWFDSSTGYWKICLNGINYMAAKIIWLIVHGEWLDNNPDHRDGNGSNDRQDNLRRATKSQNAANSCINARNTVGLKGVSYCNATGRYRASIGVSGKSINLGRYNTPEQAHRAYVTAAKKHFGEFARAG